MLRWQRRRTILPRGGFEPYPGGGLPCRWALGVGAQSARLSNRPGSWLDPSQGGKYARW